MEGTIVAIYSIAAGDVVSVKMFCYYLGQRVLYNFHYKNTNGGSMTDGPMEVRYLLGRFKTQVWTGAIQPFSNLFFQLLHLQGQKVFTTMQVYERVPVAEYGTYATGDPLPSNTSAIVSRSGSIAGRGKNSQLHLAGSSTDMLDGGFWTTAAVTLLNAVGNSLPVVLGSSTVMDAWTPVIWTPPQGTNANVIRSAESNNIPRTERRRTAGVGE